MCFFFTAGNKWYKIKYLGNNGKRAIFFKTVLLFHGQSNYTTSHGKAQFYSVATFTGKNNFKLIHNDMKGVLARTYSTNYFPRLTMESWYINLHKPLLTDVNKYRRLTTDLSRTKRKLTYGLLPDGSY